jgi:hypothetical protein
MHSLLTTDPCNGVALRFLWFKYWTEFLITILFIFAFQRETPIKMELYCYDVFAVYMSLQTNQHNDINIHVQSTS